MKLFLSYVLSYYMNFMLIYSELYVQGFLAVAAFTICLGNMLTSVVSCLSITNYNLEKSRIHMTQLKRK